MTGEAIGLPGAVELLERDDRELLRECDEERFRSTGPGGQHRNKVETAVRLRHRPSGISAEGTETRSLDENRRHALKRLKLKLALALRSPIDADQPALPEAFLRQRSPDGKLRVNESNPAFPLIVAVVLDAYAAAGQSYAGAGRILGLTTSQVVRFLKPIEARASDSSLSRRSAATSS